MGASCSSRNECEHLKKINVQNFREEYGRRTKQELKMCQVCREAVEEGEAVLCLVCGYKFCTSAKNIPVHGLKHFLFNRSHFMALLGESKLFCYKCNATLTPSQLSSECRRRYEEVVQIRRKTTHLSEGLQLTPGEGDDVEVAEHASKKKGREGTKIAEILEIEEVVPDDSAPHTDSQCKAVEGVEREAGTKLESIEAKQEETKQEEVKADVIGQMHESLGKFEEQEAGVAEEEEKVRLELPESVEEELPEESNSASLIYVSPKKRTHLRGTMVEEEEWKEDAKGRNTVSPYRLSKATGGEEAAMKVLGLINKGNSNSINCLVQCLCASRSLTSAYLNVNNFQWVSTQFNQKLQELLVNYKEHSSPINALPYVADALRFADPEFDYSKELDPAEALEKIVNSLAHSQYQPSPRSKEQPVSGVSDTFLGKLFTSVIYKRAYCYLCMRSDWAKEEKLVINIDLPDTKALQAAPDKPKYEVMEFEKNAYYTPVNSQFGSRNDVGTGLVSVFKNKATEYKECEKCGIICEYRIQHFIQTAPEILVLKCDTAPGSNLAINKFIFVDDILMISKAQLTSRKIEERLQGMKAEGGATNICGYEVYAAITKKSPLDELRSAYVKQGPAWYLTKDEFVQEISESSVFLSDPSLLFYRKAINLIL